MLLARLHRDTDPSTLKDKTNTKKREIDTDILYGIGKGAMEEIVFVSRTSMQSSYTPVIQRARTYISGSKREIMRVGV